MEYLQYICAVSYTHLEINYKTNKRLENTTKEVTELIGFMTKVSLNGFIISTKKAVSYTHLFGFSF